MSFKVSSELDTDAGKVPLPAYNRTFIFSMASVDVRYCEFRDLCRAKDEILCEIRNNMFHILGNIADPIFQILPNIC